MTDPNAIAREAEREIQRRNNHVRIAASCAWCRRGAITFIEPGATRETRDPRKAKPSCARCGGRVVAGILR
jgi:hypothetical protein